MKSVNVRRRNNSQSLFSLKVTNSSMGLNAWGPYETDAVGGFLIERRKAVRQRGGWVSARLSDGSLDIPTGDRRDDR